MSSANRYSSIVPSEMSKRELASMCADLQTARNWGQDKATVFLTSVNLEYKVDVADLPDYQEAHRSITGGTRKSKKEKLQSKTLCPNW